MKRSLIFLMAAALLVAGCSGGSKFTVQGDLASAGLLSPADSVKVENDALPVAITAPVVDGAFKLTGKVDGAEFSRISVLGGSRRSTRVFIAEKGTVTFQDGLPCGTPLNDACTAFTQRLRGLRDQYSGEDLKNAVTDEFRTFVGQHKKDPCAVYAILLGNHRLEPAVLRELIESTTPEIRNNGDIRSLYRMLPHE